MQIRVFGLWFFLAILGAVSVASYGMSDADIRTAIEQVLQERHPSDTPEFWRGLGPSAPRVILRMSDETKNQYHKLRLLQALAWFDDPEASQFVKDQGDSTPNAVTRGAAIRTIGISQGAKAVDWIARFLNHPDAQTRVAAAETLVGIEARIDSTEDKMRLASTLENFLKRESVPWIKSKIESKRLAAKQDRYTGKWKGIWVELQGKELSTRSATAEAVFVASGQWSAVLSLVRQDETIELSGKLSQEITGVLRRGGKKSEIHGSIASDPATRWVLDIPGESATLILTRE